MFPAASFSSLVSKSQICLQGRTSVILASSKQSSKCNGTEGLTSGTTGASSVVMYIARRFGFCHLNSNSNSASATASFGRYRRKRPFSSVASPSGGQIYARRSESRYFATLRTRHLHW